MFSFVFRLCFSLSMESTHIFFTQSCKERKDRKKGGKTWKRQVTYFHTRNYKNNKTKNLFQSNLIPGKLQHYITDENLSKSSRRRSNLKTGPPGDRTLPKAHPSYQPQEDRPNRRMWPLRTPPWTPPFSAVVNVIISSRRWSWRGEEGRTAGKGREEMRRGETGWEKRGGKGRRRRDEDEKGRAGLVWEMRGRKGRTPGWVGKKRRDENEKGRADLGWGEKKSGKGRREGWVGDETKGGTGWEMREG